MFSTYNELESFDIELNNENLIKGDLNSSNLSTKMKIDGRIFEGFSLDILSIHKDLLLDSAKTEVFKESYNYKPSYLSTKLYGTPVLAYLLLYVNDMSSSRQFHTSNVPTGSILVPSLEAINVLYNNTNLINSEVLPLDELQDNTKIIYSQFNY